MQCDVDGSESVDLSAYYWDFIGASAHEEKPGSLPEGSNLAMIEADMDVDDDHDEAPLSAQWRATLSSRWGCKISGKELDAIIASEGSVEFHNYEGKTRLLAACEGYRGAITQHSDALMEGVSEHDREAPTEAATELEERAHHLQTVLQRKLDMAAPQANLAGPDLLVRACSAHSFMLGEREMACCLLEGLGCDVNARAARTVHEGKGRVGRLGPALMQRALAAGVVKFHQPMCFWQRRAASATSLAW